MLSTMRKHAQSWLIKVALGLIVVVFVFYFGVSRYGQKAVKLATVNGEPIAHQEYSEVYNNMLRQAQQQYKDMLNDKLLQILNLKQRALDSVIDEKITETGSATIAFYRYTARAFGKHKNSSVFSA